VIYVYALNPKEMNPMESTSQNDTRFVTAELLKLTATVVEVAEVPTTELVDAAVTPELATPELATPELAARELVAPVGACD